MTPPPPLSLPDDKIVLTIAQQFAPAGDYAIKNIQKIGNGIIHNTLLIELNDTSREKFILQKINMEVFPRPERINQNIRTISEHVAAQQQNALFSGQPSSLRLPQLMATKDNLDHFKDDSGNYWRALTFIDNATCFDIIQNKQHAREIGKALGTFHSLLIDLPLSKLFVTLKNFHKTPLYIDELFRVLHQDCPLSPETKSCVQFVRERADQASVLEDAFQKGALAKRPIHGDPKINNFMMDTENGKAISLIDLDTVQPGLILYDIGDCLRSGCNAHGEETKDWKSVEFNLEHCKAILSGYLSAAGNSLSENDFACMLDAIRLIPFELGVRFLTDHLKGNVYFQTKHPRQNLHRALVQFQLTKSIEKQRDKINTIIQAAG